MTQIKTIFFDLDDTLVDNLYAQRAAMADTYEHFRSIFHAIPLDRLNDEFEKVNLRLWEQLSRHEITAREYYQQRFLQTLQKVFSLTPLIKYDLRDAFTIDPYFDERYEAHVRETAAATDLLNTLHGRYDLGLITNGFRDIQHRKLAALGWTSLFSHIITSEDAGAMKPHEDIFFSAERASAREPKEIVFVGDNFHNDVAAAKRHGWRTVWFNPRSHEAPDASADFEVRTLHDVAAMFQIVPV